MSSLEIAHKQRIPVKNNGPGDPIQAIHLFEFKMQLMLESVKSLQDKEKMLKEENQQLQKQIVAMKNGGEIYNGKVDHPLGHPPQQRTLCLLK